MTSSVHTIASPKHFGVPWEKQAILVHIAWPFSSHEHVLQPSLYPVDPHASHDTLGSGGGPLTTHPCSNLFPLGSVPAPHVPVFVSPVGVLKEQITPTAFPPHACSIGLCAKDSPSKKKKTAKEHARIVIQEVLNLKTKKEAIKQSDAGRPSFCWVRWPSGQRTQQTRAL